MEARKQGQPSRSKLDAHEAFILGLIELAEIGERLVAERGVWAAPSTVWLFLDRRGIMFKNVWPVGKRFISDGGWSASTYTAYRLIAVAKIEIRTLRAS
ncbi:hypothetical protein [Mesorhizobium sp. M0140]|uniref:hypothetical protein n=1 Tax=Mesorhizobium sp. M0140 TaxID=2956893 RepID=UPI0033356938